MPLNRFTVASAWRRGPNVYAGQFLRSMRSSRT